MAWKLQLLKLQALKMCSAQNRTREKLITELTPSLPKAERAITLSTRSCLVVGPTPQYLGFTGRASDIFWAISSLGLKYHLEVVSINDRFSYVRPRG
jgi:hypothetical protein